MNFAQANCSNGTKIHHEHLESLQSRQAEAQRQADIKWWRAKAPIYNKLRQHINSLIRNETAIQQTLERQADRAKPYVKLTGFSNPLANPLKYLSIHDQETILNDLLDEFQPMVTHLYGPEFYLDVQYSSFTPTNIALWIHYDLYLFYHEVTHLNS
jgi:hypothetical protein